MDVIQAYNSTGASATGEENVPQDISPTEHCHPSPSDSVIHTTAAAKVHVSGQINKELTPLDGYEEDVPSGYGSDVISHRRHGCGTPIRRPASPDDIRELPGEMFPPMDESVESAESTRKPSSAHLKPYSSRPASSR